jgi:exopolysaccharide biosynthesis polyprenyl glycosylphosphotransferase
VSESDERRRPSKPPPITPKAGSFTTLKSSPPPVPTGKSAPPPRPASSPPSPFIDTVVAMPPPPLPKIAPIVPRRSTSPAKTTPISPGDSAPPATTPSVTIADPIVKEKDPAAPPIIRIPHGGMLGGSSKMKSPRAGTLICEILLKNNAITQDVIDKAIALQEERGGQIGRILVQMGACSEEAIARALIEQLRLRRDEGQSSDISLAAREQKDVVGLKVLTRPARTVATLLATDIFSLLLAALLATSVHWFRTYSELQTLDWTAWLVVGPSIGLCVLTFLGLELYSPMAKSTPDEIRDITFAASLVHLGASLLSTLGDLPIVKWGVFVRGVWWAATLVLVPVVRALVRNALSVKPWWGIPVCVLGAAKTGRLVVRTLKAQPRSGLKPVMLLDDDQAKHGTLRASFTNEVMDVYSVNVDATHFLTESQRAKLSSDLFDDPEADRANQPISSDHIPVAAPIDEVTGSAPASSEKEPLFSPESRRYARSSRASITQDAAIFPRGKFAEVDGVPLVGELALAPVLASRLKIPYAVLAMPGVESSTLLQIVERIGGKFTHLLIIPDLFGFATTGVPAKSLGGILSVEVRQQLLLPGPRLAKRIMDIAATVFGLIFVLPFLLLVAALIKLDSKGPVFYTQKRLGRDGSYFRAYKFRTMHGDGEERLKAILEADPELRAEYEVYHKLKKDPRVTRIGRVLRKFSLDEFPQLLNVIKGEMSLVGPRPYIERELTEMGGQEKIILRAPPGMTGMWQVSDRNATSFAQRVLIDVYYVRNWSPWLDIHILAKTFGVVIRGTGS